MTELYPAEWLAAPHKNATLRAVTEHHRADFPPGRTLGKPCRKHGHTWNGTPWNLLAHGKCMICEVERLKIRNELYRIDPERKALKRASDRSREQRNREHIYVRRRQRLAENPELRQRGIDAKRKARSRLAEQGLTSRGTPRKPRPEPVLPYQHAIRLAGSPSVAKLVLDEQRRYWREHPDAFKAADNFRRLHQWRLRYLTDPRLRRYSHEKSRRRKARLRGNHVIQVTTVEISKRFDAFGHACAYCGCSGDLHIEHFLPISKGGTHVLSNILPACQPCNYSKRNHDPETWYRAQPFFSEQRWKRILTTLGKQHTPVGQLTLI
jgi:5-methylcytosine-specific restriction endonuclease McrA